MKGLIIFFSVILFFLLIGLLKIGVVIGYSKEVSLGIKLLFLNIKILPKKEKGVKLSNFSKKAVRKYDERERLKKEKSAKKKAEKKAKKAAAKKEKKLNPPPKKKLSEKVNDITKKVNDTVTLVKVILDVVRLLFSKLFGYIKTEVISLKLAIGAGDPDKTAVIYGATMAGVTGLLEFLDGHSELKIRAKDAVSVIPDFPGHGFEADVKIIISFRVWQIFGMIIPPAVRAGKHFIPRLLDKGGKNKKGDKSKKQQSAENQASGVNAPKTQVLKTESTKI